MDWLKKGSKAKSINPNNRLDEWSHDKLKTVMIQRNILFLLCFIALSALGVGVFAVMQVSKYKTVEPFIIEIAKKSGVVTLVDPVTIKQYSANRVINEYFLIKYMKARELFNPNTYPYYYYTEVRLLSSKEVYTTFRQWIRLSNQESPLVMYGNTVTESDLKVISIQYMEDQLVQIRFSVQFKGKDRVVRKNKVAYISYDYLSLEMNEMERQVNPLGFLITSYKVDDEFF